MSTQDPVPPEERDPRFNELDKLIGSGDGSAGPSKRRKWSRRARIGDERSASARDVESQHFKAAIQSAVDAARRS